MPDPIPRSPDATPSAHLSWGRGTAAEVEVAALIGVRLGVVVLLTDIPVPPGWPVRLDLEGPRPAGGPSTAATVLSAVAVGADRYLVRLGLPGGPGAATFLRTAAARLDMPEGWDRLPADPDGGAVRPRWIARKPRRPALSPDGKIHDY